MSAGRLAEMFKAHSFMRMTCYDHEGRCCPAGCHDLTVDQYDHYAEVVLELLDSDEVHGAVADTAAPHTWYYDVAAAHALAAIRTHLTTPTKEEA